jgi:hypothetical protein
MCVERRDERGGVGEYSEVVQDLRNAVVREHGELADAVREERVWVGFAGRREGRPSLGYHDLGTFPEEDCVRTHDQCVCMRVIRMQYTDLGVLRTKARPGRTGTYLSPSARVVMPCRHCRTGAGTPR